MPLLQVYIEKDPNAYFSEFGDKSNIFKNFFKPICDVKSNDNLFKMKGFDSKILRSDNLEFSKNIDALIQSQCKECPDCNDIINKSLLTICDVEKVKIPNSNNEGWACAVRKTDHTAGEDVNFWKIGYTTQLPSKNSRSFKEMWADIESALNRD